MAMHAVTIIFLVSIASLLNLVDAHGFHHPGTREEDPSFDNLVEQKYPTLADLDANFVATHRRQLAEDFTHDSEGNETLLCGNCYQNPSDKKWFTCDDLVLSGYTCSHLETKVCKNKCTNCLCSCEKTCNNGKSCDEMMESNEAMTCAKLEAEQGCNCRGCSKCGDGCTQKCSMRNTNIKGSHDCATWYRMDPKYTTKFLKTNAVVTDTVGDCTCEGCKGNKALDFCPSDIPDQNSNYMDIETAKAKGKIGRMRLTINDDMVDPEKCKKNDFCRKHTCLEGDVGKKTINNCDFERGEDKKHRDPKSQCLVTCKEEDILTPEKSFMVRRRFGWLKTFMGDLLSLKPTQDVIKLNDKKVHFIEGLRDHQTKKIPDFPDSDLVVVVTMRPAYNPSVAGYAITYQRDTERRATVGLFNWVPHTVDATLYDIEKKEETLSIEEKAGLLYAKAADYRLMVHEVLHLTGAIQSDPYYFINKLGKAPCSHQIYVDEVEEWSGHRVRKIRTPNLLARAREQFACSSLTGVPMEDHHIGYNAHWESRVFGSEIMSYGDNSGESYLSDLTLAFLEDTGYYAVNYSVGGRLTPHTAPNIELANVPSLLTKDTDKLKKKIGEAGNTSKNERTPGYTRWGRHAGCGFVTGSPKNWPEAYRCVSPSSGGCTPDHKMTARCTLETWGLTAIAASTIRCEPPAQEPWGGKKTSRAKWSCIKNNAGGSIPEEYRHLGPTDTLAGYNDAMDYVPHYVGFWNCQDKRPKKLSPLDVASEAGASQNVSAGWDDLFGALASDSNDIQGQSRCENCRCFRSSLVPIHNLKKISPTFPIFGLCYVSNCYSEEYLQVGIKGVRGLYWYGCPPEGGKMYIPLFTGSLRCPVAKEFCSVEPLSGVIYTETDANLEWIAYGVVGGIFLISAILLCIFWKKIDHKVHFCCGIDQDHKDWDTIMENRHGKHSASGYCLTVIGAIWAIGGAALALFGLYSFFLPFVEEVKPLWDTQTRQAPAMITIGAFTLFTSICAIEGAWKNKPTITLITYFYVCVCTLVLCAVIPVLPIILSEPLELILESQWVRYKNNFPDSWQDFNSTAAMNHVVEVALPEYALYFAIAATVLIVSVIAGIVCSILQLTIHVIVRNFEVVMNSVFFVLGCLLVYFAVRNFNILDVYIYVSAIIPACFLVVVGAIGVLAACQKHETCFKFWAVLAAIGFIVTLVTASCLVWVSLSPVKDAGSSRSPSTCVLPDKTSKVCEAPKQKCCACVLAVEQVDIQLATSTAASAATTKGLVAVAKTFTGCEHSCFDVPGYACTEVGINTTIAAAAAAGEKSLLMQLDPYIRSLDDDEIAEISTSMAESLEIVDFNVEQLVAWLTAYVRIYAALLYVSCLVICGLFATNRLIIHWNHQNDFPHGEHPYYLMFAVSVKKQNMQQKLHAVSVLRSFKFRGGSKFKGINRRTPLLKSISRAALHTRDIFRPKKNISPIIEVEIFRDANVGLGMSMVGATYGPNEHHCLTVNAFRTRPDGSPGPAQEVGVQIGDRVLTANGYAITDFSSLQRAVGNSDSVTIEVERNTNIIEEERGPVNYDDHYPEIVMLHVRRASPSTKMSAKLAEVHAQGHSSYYDDDETSHVVVKDVWDGPLYQGGMLVNDVLLTIDDYNVETLNQVGSLVQGKTEMDFVVKRMAQSQNENSRRENKVYTCNITIDGQLGLGLNLKEIKSGLGDRSSNTFLYVKELREFADFAPGPGLIAGVRQYDLVLKINDMAVHTIADAKRAIEGQKIAKCEVRRMIRHFNAGHPYHPTQHGEAKEVDLVVTRAVGESLGLSLTESYGADSVDPFLVVTKVRPGSAGERAGIRVQDILWRAQGQDVYNLDDLKTMIGGLEKFELTVRRQG